MTILYSFSPTTSGALFPTPWATSGNSDGANYVATEDQSRQADASVRVNTSRSSTNEFRSEYSSANQLNYTNQSEYWWAFSVFIPPEPLYTFDSVATVVAQLHDAPDAGDSIGLVPFALLISGGNWAARVRYSAAAEPATDVDVTTAVSAAYDAVTRGWHDFMIHFRPDHSTTNGFFELWHNQDKWIDYSGNFAHNDALGVYSKFGVYIASWNGGPNTDTDSQTLYFDDIKIGDSSERFSTMRPASRNPSQPRVLASAGAFA